MIVIIFLMNGKGSSTGIMPSQVSIKKTHKKFQKIHGIYVVLLFWISLDLSLKGIIIKIDITNPKTPPNLLGIDRKIAYAKRKYHSGWMWGGVINGFAGVKFSGSIKLKGIKVFIKQKIKIKRVNLVKSLNLKYGWKGILSEE